MEHTENWAEKIQKIKEIKKKKKKKPKICCSRKVGRSKEGQQKKKKRKETKGLLWNNFIHEIKFLQGDILSSLRWRKEKKDQHGSMCRNEPSTLLLYIIAHFG